jgi:cobalt/nickel transport protein
MMKGYIKAIVLAVLGLALFVPLASTFPDGLETVAETLGIGEREPSWQGVMPNYTFPSISNAYASKFLSGLIGILLVLAFAFVVGKVLTRGSTS